MFLYGILIVGLGVGVVVAILAWIVRIIQRRNKHPGSVLDTPNWYMRIALSTDDLISQVYAVMGFWLVYTLFYAINVNFSLDIKFETLIAVVSALAVGFAYWQRIVVLVPLAIGGLTFYWVMTSARWSMNSGDINVLIVPLIFFIFTIFLYIVGRIHDHLSLKRTAFIYTCFAMITTGLALGLLSSKIGISLLSSIESSVSFVQDMRFTSVLGVIVFASLVGLGYCLVKKCIRMPEVLGLVAVVGVVVSAYMLSGAKDLVSLVSTGAWTLTADLSPKGVLWSAFFNLAFFGYLAGLLFLGYARRELWLINGTAVVLFIVIIVKYFDWFYAFMNKSLFFMTAGIVFFALAWFMQKGRKKFVKNIS